MSNGDDVLDNWEEIDEAGITDTLQKLQAERQIYQLEQEKKTLLKTSNAINTTTTSFTYSDAANASSSTSVSNSRAVIQPTVPTTMKLLQRTQNTQETAANIVQSSPLDDMAATFQPVMMVLHKTDDEYQSTNYTPATNNQTVKILRRPTQSSESRNNGGKPKQPIKTLQQREQEYAEARLRILGSAKNPEDDKPASTVCTTSNSLTTSSTTTATPTTPATPLPQAVLPTFPTATAAPINRTNTSPKIQTGLNMYNNHYYQQQPPPPQQQQINYFFHQPQQQHQQFIQQQTTLIPAYNNRMPQIQSPPQQQQQPHKTWSPVVGGSVSSSAIRQPLNQPLTQQQQQFQQDSILRLPRGPCPDGSNGFQMRR